MTEVSPLSPEHETKRIIDVGQFVSAATLQLNAVQKALVQNQVEPAEFLAGIICAYCSPDFHWATLHPDEINYDQDAKIAVFARPEEDGHILKCLPAVQHMVMPGQFLVEIRVHEKNDEMWIGLTSRDPDFEYIWIGELAVTSDAWSYYGGREQFILEYADRTKPDRSGHQPSGATACCVPASGYAHLTLADGPFGAPHPLTEDVLNLYGPRVLTHPLRKASYSAGDKVGLLIDLSRGTMAAYLNDSFQFETTRIPMDRPLYLFAVVDGPGDHLELLPLRVPAPS